MIIRRHVTLKNSNGEFFSYFRPDSKPEFVENMLLALLFDNEVDAYIFLKKKCDDDIIAVDDVFEVVTVYRAEWD